MNMALMKKNPTYMSSFFTQMMFCRRGGWTDEDEETVVGAESSFHSSLSVPPISPRHQARRSRLIDVQLKESNIVDMRIIKILLLGGSGSGKTTIFRQMRILHMEGFPPTDYENYRYIIHSNAVESVNQLLEACEELDIPTDISIQGDVREFREFQRLFPQGYYELGPHIAAVISRIWASHAVNKAYELRYKFQLLESAKYYLDDIDRIAEAGYKPSTKDIICCRFQTTGIYEMTFNYRKITLRMVDVGGQRTERKKWIHVFDNVNLILFVIAISEYVAVDHDDPNINGLEGAFRLFESVTKSPYFDRTSFLLFLNKMDIFTDTLPHNPLRNAFSEYNGEDGNVEDAIAWINEEFRERLHGDARLVTHATTATDTNHIALVFETSMDEIISKNMAVSGL